mgnify:FL=1
MHAQPWPEVDTEALAVTTVELPVQINGKVRERIQVSADSSADGIKEQVLALPRVRELLSGKSIVKCIVIPGKIINIVVK